MHQYALSSLHSRSAVQELVRGHPAQDQRSGFRGVDARRYRGQVACPERAIGRIGSEHRHVGHTVAKLKSAHAIAELIDFPDDIVANYERWASGRCLRVEMASETPSRARGGSRVESFVGGRLPEMSKFCLPGGAGGPPLVG